MVKILAGVAGGRGLGYPVGAPPTAATASMAKMLVGVAWGLLAITARSSAVEDATKYDLKYKFTPGEVVRTEVVHRATVETVIMGSGQTADTRSTSIKCWKIVEVNESGRIKLEHSVESIDLWQKMQGRAEVHYNSETDKTVPPGYEDAAKAVGVPLTSVTIDARGKILDREVLLPQPNANPGQITLLLPAEPVSVGHVWSNQLDVEVALQPQGRKKVQVREQFTLSKVAKGIATIEMDSQVLTPIDDPAVEAQLVQRLAKGTIEFDIERGRVVGQQLDSDRRVLGISGASSMMHYITRYTEKLLEANEKTATKPKQQKSK